MHSQITKHISHKAIYVSVIKILPFCSEVASISVSSPCFSPSSIVSALSMDKNK